MASIDMGALPIENARHVPTSPFPAERLQELHVVPG